MSIWAHPRLLLLSTNLPEHETLAAAVLPHVHVIMVKASAYTLHDLQLQLKAHGRTRFESIALFDHGRPGAFHLLNAVPEVMLESLSDASSARFEIISFFVELAKLVQRGGTIDLLACSVAGSPRGQALLSRLEKLTGVNWAASTDATGAGAHVEAGFDYDLESDGRHRVDKLYFDERVLRKWRHSAGWNSSLEAGLGMMIDGGGPLGEVGKAMMAQHRHGQQRSEATDWTMKHVAYHAGRGPDPGRAPAHLREARTKMGFGPDAGKEACEELAREQGV